MIGAIVKLVDLQPHWCGMNGWSSPEQFFVGLTYLCPHCMTQRLGVMFANPIDPANLRERYGWTWDVGTAYGQNVWQRTGDTFETLTLVPSVDCSASGHWHGTITNGEVIPDARTA